MLPFVALEFIFFNNGALGLRIACLSNTHKNLIYIMVVCFIGFSGRISLNPSYLLIAMNLVSAPNVVPALTNTLFSIHPPLLYLCSVMALKMASRNSRYEAYVWLSALIFSTCLGGFWSMQELSWGGWWNWDVLECGIAFIIVTLIALLHSRWRYLLSGRSCNAACLVYMFYTYNTLNKLGLATSIHSFVSSKSVRNHYPLIALLHLALYHLCASKYLSRGLILSAVIYVSYTNLKWCIFLKKPTALILAGLLFRAPSLKLTLKITHSPITVITALVFYINLFNFSFLANTSTKTWLSFTYGYGQFFKFIKARAGATPVIWDKLFLSKPRYSYGASFLSSGTRNLNFRSNYLIFLK